jgi:hypothetical protein
MSFLMQHPAEAGIDDAAHYTRNVRKDTPARAHCGQSGRNDNNQSCQGV